MAIASDSSTPAYKTAANGATTTTTASFTPPASSLLVVMWASGVNRSISGITSSAGGTWKSLNVDTGAQGGDLDMEIWCADAPSGATTVTVTHTLTNGANQAGYGCAVLTGAAAAASQPGAVPAGTSSATGDPSASATTTANGSLVVGAFTTRASVVPTVPGGQTQTFGAQAFLGANNGAWGQTTTTPTTSSGTVVTINDTAIGNEWGVVLAEILAGTGGGSPTFTGFIPSRMPIGV